MGMHMTAAPAAPVGGPAKVLEKCDHHLPTLRTDALCQLEMLME